MRRINNISLLLLILFSSLQLSQSYLQFKLNRIPHHSKKLKQQQFNCPQSISAIQQADYKQVCYDKDISYSFQIYKDGRLYLISADFTTPISWFKGKDCLLDKSEDKCTFIEKTFSETVSDYTSSIKKKLKRHKATEKGESRQKAQIQGSSNVIKGYLERPPHMSFQIMDSNRLTRLVDILLLGFFVLGQKDALELQSTKFINTTSITPKLNYISDGAISLRFDQNSQNSFLNQIFQYTKAQQKIATLYLGQNNYLALGELSLKFSQHGYSGISWVKVQQDQNFGKIPTVSYIIVEDRQRQIQKKITLNKPAVLTLSASYIGMHSSMIQRLNSKLSKSATCQFQQHGYLKCKYTKKSDKDKDYKKRLTFAFGQSSISLQFKELVLHEQSQFVIFNIKQLYQEDYLVLGEPVFKKYTLYLDYGQERVGFALRRQHFRKQFINVVSLIRFLVMVFCCGIFFIILGCCFILCSAPCRVVWNRLVSRPIRLRPHGREGLRLKQYSPVQQNPYDQISEKIKSMAATKQTTDVDERPDDQI